MTNPDKQNASLTNANKSSAPEGLIWQPDNTPWNPENNKPFDESTVGTNTTFTNRDKL